MDCEKNPFLQMSQDQIQKLDAVLSSEQAKALLQATSSDKLFSDPKLDDVLSHGVPIGPMEEGKLPPAIEETLNLGVSLKDLEHLVLDQAASGSGIFGENSEVADILDETQNLVNAIWLDHCYALPPVTVASVSTEVTSSDLALASIEPTRPNDSTDTNLVATKTGTPVIEIAEKQLQSTPPITVQNLTSETSSPVTTLKLSDDFDETTPVGSHRPIISSPSGVLSESENSDSSKRNDKDSKIEPVRRSQRQLDKIEREQVEKIRAENAAIQRRELEEMEKLKTQVQPTDGQCPESELPNNTEKASLGDGIVESDDEKSLAILRKEGKKDPRESPKVSPNKPDRKLSVASPIKSIQSEDEKDEKKCRRASSDRKGRDRTDSETSTDDSKLKLNRSKSVDHGSPLKVSRKSPKSRISLEEKLAEELKKKAEESAKKEAEELAKKEKALELKRKKLKKEKSQHKLEDFEPALFSLPDKIIKDKSDCKSTKPEHLDEVKPLKFENELKLENLDCPEAKREIKEFKEKSEANSNVSLSHDFIGSDAEPYNELALIANHLMESDAIPTANASSSEPGEQKLVLGSPTGLTSAAHKNPRAKSLNDDDIENKVTLNKTGKGPSTKPLISSSNEAKSLHPKAEAINPGLLKHESKTGPIKETTRPVISKPLVILSNDGRKILSKDGKVIKEGSNRNLTKEQKMAMKSKLSNINMENVSKTKKKGYIVKHLLMKSKKQEQLKQARVEGRPILKKKSSNLKSKSGNFPSRRPVSQRHRRKKGMPGDDLEYSDDSDDSDWDSEDDPEKLWCICRKPSNDRFMIQCDYCSDWFHGSCVNVTKQLGKQMEKEQKEWKCPRCIKGMPPVSAQPVILDAVEKPKQIKKPNPVSEVKESANVPKTIAISTQIGKCIMCKKPSSKESIYCSALCIEKHGSEVLKGMPKEAGKSVGKIELKPVQRLLVVEKKSGKLLMGSNAPTSENLVAWLKANPTYEVVKSGPVTQSRRNSEPVSPVKKVLKAESTPLEEKQPESVRQNVRKTLKEILVLRCKEADDVDTSEDEIKRITLNIEEHLFRLFKDTGSKYKSKYRSLMFNVKDPRNQGLFRKIVKGKIPPDQLVKKTPEELASKELAMWREREAQHALEMIKKEQLEQLQNPTHLIKKTHKGEVEVQDDQLLIIEIDEKTEASVEATEKALDMGQMLADTTNEHRSHLFDLNCKICTGKKTPAESKEEKPNIVKVATTISIERSEFTETEKEVKSGDKTEYPAPPKVSKPKKSVSIKKSSKRSNSIQEEASDHEPTSTVSFGSPDGEIKAKKSKKDSSSKGPPSVWKGFIYMIDVAKFVTSALRVSGPTDNLNTDIPDSVQVCGRISPEEVWSYLGKIKQSGNKELIIIKFQPANDEEKSTYESFFSYLNSRKRYGVVKSSCKTIKDFYIVPLSSHTPVPTVLMPFNGPGLETNRPNLLLGVLVRHKSRSKSLSSRSKSKSSDKVEPYEPSYTPPLDAMPCQSTTVDSSNSVPSLYQPTTLKPEKVSKKKIKVSVDDEPYEPSYTPPLEKIPKLTSDEDKPYDPEENAELETPKPGLDIRSLLPILSTKSSLPPASATSLLTSVASAAITANTDLETQKKLLAELTREVEHQKEQIEQKNRSLVGNVSRILSTATDSPKVGSLTPPNPPPVKVTVPDGVKKASVVLDRSGNLSANLQDIQIPDMLQSILNNIRGKPSVNVNQPSISDTKHFDAKSDSQFDAPTPNRIMEKKISSPFSSILGSSGNVIPFLSDDTPKILNPPMMTSNKVFSNISDMRLKGDTSIPSFLVPQNKPLITTPITVKEPLRKDDSLSPAKSMIHEIPPKSLLQLAHRNAKSQGKIESKPNEPLAATSKSDTSTPKAGIHFTIKRLKPQALPCNNSPIVEPEPLKKSKIGDFLPVKTAIPERSLTPPLPPPTPKRESVEHVSHSPIVSNPTILTTLSKNESSLSSSSLLSENAGVSTWSPVAVADSKFKTITERISQASLSLAPITLLPNSKSLQPPSTPPVHAIPVPLANSSQMNKSSLNVVNSPCSISTTPPHSKPVNASLKSAEPTVENSQMPVTASNSASSSLRVQPTQLPTVPTLAPNTWPSSTFTEPPPPGVESEDIQAKERLLPPQSSLANQQYQSISYPSQSGYSVQSTFYNPQTSQHPYYMAQNPQWNRAPGSVGNIRPPLHSSWAQNQHYQQPNQPYQHYQQHPQVPHHSQPQPYHQHSQSYTQPHNQQQHSQPHNTQHPQARDQQSHQHLMHAQHNNNQSTDQLNSDNQTSQSPNLQPLPPQVPPQNPQQYRPRIHPPIGNRMPWRSPKPRWNEPNSRWNNERGGYDDYNRRDWERGSRSHSRGRNRSRDKSADRDKSRENTPEGATGGKDESRKRERSKDRASSRNSSDHSQDRSRSGSRSKSRSRSPDGSRSRGRSRARSVKSRDGSRDRSKSADKDRDRSRDRSRSYDRSRSRSRERSRDRSRSRGSSHSRSRGYSRDRSKERGRRENWKNFKRYNGGRDRYRRRPNFWDKRKT